MNNGNDRSAELHEIIWRKVRHNPRLRDRLRRYFASYRRPFRLGGLIGF